MNENRDANSAALERIDADFTLTIVLRDMMISNGLAWSPDGRTMYHADTPTRTIRAFDYDAATGIAVERRARSPRSPAATDRPDGGAVDSAGNYWTRVLPRRQGGQAVAARRAARRISDARDVPDDVRVRRSPTCARCT